MFGAHGGQCVEHEAADRRGLRRRECLTPQQPSQRPLDLVHRDITPDNILISREGDVKVADLGLAKATDSDDGNDD